MKKILMVCESFGGGVFAYVSQLCNDLCDTFEIFLAYAIRPQTPKDFQKKIDPRVHLIEVQYFGGLKNPFRFLACIKELRRIAKAVSPQIIHMHSSIAGGVGRIAFSSKKYKLVYTPHGYAHILLGKGKKARLFSFLEKWLGKKDCITLTCCESENDEAKNITSRSAFIETGLNIQSLSKDLDRVKEETNDKFTVFTLGRACEQKQPRVFNRIAELVPEADFIWVGGGELEGQLTAPNIKITGWLDRTKALEIAKSSDAFVLCSLGEAIAMSLIENMFLQKLCLVSNVMGNKSVIKNGENGYVCNEPEEYAAHIREAMANYPYHLVQQAYADVMRVYNTSVMKTKFVDFYNSLL